VNTNTSRHNCGGCGNVCAAGQMCQNDECRCAGGFDLCGADAGSGGQCTNTRVDRNNCGTCGNVCAGACAMGDCRP
jgi:hypothetical protein